MDTQNAILVAKCDSVAIGPGQKVVVGAKQLRKALSRGCAQRVFLARNADPALTEPLEALCKSNGVQYCWVKTMSDLGNACGIEVGAAAAAVIG